MAIKTNLEHKSKQRTMTIEGHKITLSFTQERNPDLSAKIRTTLIDAYIRSNSIPPCEAQA